MRVLFLGCLFNEQEENSLLKRSKIGLSGAANAYQWNLINGLDANLDRSVDIINVLPVGTYPLYFKDIVLRTKKWAHSPESHDIELGSFNLPFIKQVIRTLKCQKAIKQWLRKGCYRCSVIVYSTYLPYLLAVRNLPSTIKVTLVVTDLPEYYDLTASRNVIKKLLRAIYNHLIYALLKRIDSFVLLTEQMKGPLKIGNRPYVVIEGIANEKSLSYVHKGEKSTKKIVMYTGTLNYAFGIRDLLDAFNLITDENYELWICGSGEAEKEVIERSQSDNRIKYLGYVSKAEVNRLQQYATLLINPRKNDSEYTKYSFPSKTMEYMLSGNPVLMYKLDGIPDEYDDFLFYVSGNNSLDLVNVIENICNLPHNFQKEFGSKARQFLLSTKNPVIQSKKIIDMINATFEE